MEKIIHSFNTAPVFTRQWGIDSPVRLFGMVWYYALSLAYCRRLGIEVGLHADSLGAALLSHLPYSDIHTDLDDIPREIHPRIWAVGKAFALRNSEPGAVHIDGDVFIKKESCARAIFDTDWDVIVQYDEPEFFYDGLKTQLAHCKDHFLANGLDMIKPGAFNTGVIGFRDTSVRDRYCQGWIDNALGLSADPGPLDTDENITPDLMLEQKYLAQVCEASGARVHRLLDPLMGSGDIHAAANRLGFQHVLTAVKFKELDKCREQLRRIDPEIYKSTKRLCRNF